MFLKGSECGEDIGNKSVTFSLWGHNVLNTHVGAISSNRIKDRT